MSIAHTREVTIEVDGQLRIEGLPVHAGEHVRVFVIPSPKIPQLQKSRNPYPLQGTVLRYDDPFSPACDPDDWEANR